MLSHSGGSKKAWSYFPKYLSDDKEEGVNIASITFEKNKSSCEHGWSLKLLKEMHYE